ncbi:MAG: aminoglycoside phosphotransferase family protein [Chloroflexi bacterium]|nr:aminoglycoside phosphotransferase family protein [Chloroflexota bacterium]OJV92522.1 MAG: trifolitoxin immunity protein [Chloroflexi bacterium 54-19]
MDQPSPADTETILSTVSSVRRKGGIVYRPAGPWTPAILALLRHLKEAGFPFSPPVIEPGLDAHNQEMVGYIEGELVHPGPWTDDAIVEVGGMIRQLHQATATFTPPAGATWKPWFLRNLGGPDFIIGHGDIAPWNVVTRAGRPVGLFDWEFAGPVDPLYELARACWLFPQLHGDDVAERVGLASPEVRANQLRLLVEAYGLSARQRQGMFDRILEVAVCETAEEAVEGKVTPESQGPLWGIAWRARAAAWMLRHRRLLEQTLA